MTAQAETTAISPCFIVGNVRTSTAFYCGKLGFETTFAEPQDDPFFAIIRRDGAQILMKSLEGVAPVPNAIRHPWARWDAFVYAPDPDALAADFATRDVTLSKPLEDTHDGLRGFEITDPDGYVLFFGRPR
jgi:catechol 2,3-dioxygenase-like lactoylglutathione lyase family enzyme